MPDAGVLPSPSRYLSLGNLIGERLLASVIRKAVKRDRRKNTPAAHALLSGIDSYVRVNRIVRTREEVPTQEYCNLVTLLRSHQLYALCESYGGRTKTVLRRLLVGVLQVNESSHDHGAALATAVSSDHFKRFVSGVVMELKDFGFIETALDLCRVIFARNQADQCDPFVRMIGGGDYAALMRTYARYPAELRDITRFALFLLLNYPGRNEYRRFIFEHMTNATFFGWVERFCDLHHYRDGFHKLSASRYLIELMYCVFVLGRYNSEFAFVFRNITGALGVGEGVKGGRRRLFAAVDNLLNAGIYFQDSAVFGDFMAFYLRFNTADRIRREVFDIVASELFGDALPPARRRDCIRFFLSDAYQRMYAAFRPASLDTLFFLTHLAAFSLRYAAGEYFKAVDEERLFETVTGLMKRDRLFHNYCELFAYITHTSESKTLRLKLIVYFYFHFAQVAGGGVRTVAFLNERHRLFTAELAKRYFQARRGPDPDMERAVFYLRLDQLADIIGFIRLPESHYRAYFYLLHLAANRRLEDELYVALVSVLRNDDLIEYEQFIRAKFLEDPFSLSLYLSKGGFYRVHFKDHRAAILRALLPVVTLIPVKASEWAKTDLRNIYLPMFVYEFDDRVLPGRISENRNFSLYVYLGLHEFSHWLARSFEYDFKEHFLETTPNPSAAFLLFNFIEDYRAEAILLASRYGEQYRACVVEGRRYYAAGGYGGSPETRLLQAMMAELYWEAPCESLYPNRAEEIAGFKNTAIADASLREEGYSCYGDIITRFVGRIRKMDIRSSRNAILLAGEFFGVLNREFNLEQIDVGLPGAGHAESGARRIDDDGGDGSDRDPMGTPPAIETAQGRATDTDYEAGRAVATSDGGAAQSGYDASETVVRDGTMVSHDDGEPAADERPVLSESEKRVYLAGLYRRLDQPDAPYGFGGTPDDESEASSESSPGVIDGSRRTVSDAHLAESMIAGGRGVLTGIASPGDVSAMRDRATDENERRKRVERAKKKKNITVYSYCDGVKGYTDIREIELYTIAGRDEDFFVKIGPYRYIIDRISAELGDMAPRLEGSLEFSDSEGELDETRLIDLFARRRDDTEPEIFRTTAYRELSEIEICIGMDASGSTSMPCGKDGLTVLDVEKIFTYLLGKSFAGLAGRISYYAFNSMSSTNVYRFPSLDDISMLASDGCNRDGDFIRYVNNLLAESDAKYKYFFLLSDGAPNADNYAGDEAVADTAMAMNECMRAGVNLVYFNIDPNCSEYFSRFIPNTTYAENFRDPHELIGKVREMVVEIVENLAC